MVEHDSRLERLITQQLKRLEGMASGDDWYHELVDEVAGVLARREPGADKILDALLDWVGDTSFSGRSSVACVVLGEALKLVEPSETAWLRDRLRAVKNDGRHIARESDLLGVFLAADRHRPEALAAALTESLASENPFVCLEAVIRWGAQVIEEAQPLTVSDLFKTHAPAVLLGLTRFDETSPAFTAAITVFREFFRRNADAAVDAVLDTIHDRDLLESLGSDELKIAGATLLCNFKALNCPNLPALLAKRLFIGRDDDLLATLLIQMGEPGFAACFDRVSNEKDGSNKSTLYWYISCFGPSALNWIINHIKEEGSQRFVVDAVLCLVSFFAHVQRGASDPANTAKVAAIEKILRSEEVKTVLESARSRADRPEVSAVIDVYLDELLTL